MERAVIALRPTDSRDEVFFPAFPAGTLKQFFLQWTTSA